MNTENSMQDKDDSIEYGSFHKENELPATILDDNNGEEQDADWVSWSKCHNKDGPAHIEHYEDGEMDWEYLSK